MKQRFQAGRAGLTLIKWGFLAGLGWQSYRLASEWLAPAGRTHLLHAGTLTALGLALFTLGLGAMRAAREGRSS